MRLIDADALREATQHAAFIRWKDVEDAPTVGGWISVKDRLPEEDDYRKCHENEDGAVFWFNGEEIGMGWYYTSTKTWSDLNDHGVSGVTHWRRLFELPEEVSGDA